MDVGMDAGMDGGMDGGWTVDGRWVDAGWTLGGRWVDGMNNFGTGWSRKVDGMVPEAGRDWSRKVVKNERFTVSYKKKSFFQLRYFTFVKTLRN